MNQRESSGLPLRAMVMVLLFLGLAFLLVAFQAMGSGDGDDDASSASSSVSTTASSASPTSSSAAPEPAKADVRVYNVSEVAGLADEVANRLREQDWNVTETGNLVLEDVPVTTVYWGQTPGERQAAEEVGKILEAPVEERTPALAEQPPGVIVAATG